MRFGELLRLEIERRGINQMQAAHIMGVQQTAVSRWVNGTSGPPTLENCRKLAQFMDMPLMDVMRLTGYVPEDATDESTKVTDPDRLADVYEVLDIMEPLEPEKRPSIIQMVRAAVDMMLPKPVPPVSELVSSVARPTPIRRTHDDGRGTIPTRTYRSDDTTDEIYCELETTVQQQAA